jgi:cell division septal protein FtsQ
VRKKKAGKKKILGRKVARYKLLSRIALFVTFILILALFSWLFQKFLNEERYHIDSISVTGNEILDSSTIERFVREYLEEDYFLMPQSHILVFKESGLEYRLQQELPEIKAVEIFQQQQDISLDIKERSPDALWCNETLEDCQYVDKDAFAYKQAPGTLENIYLVVLTEETPSLRAYPLPTDLYKSIRKFSEDLEALLEHDTTRISFDEKDILYDFKYFSVYTTQDRLGENIIDDIRVVKNQLPLFSKNSLKSLEYIDVRFPDKVLYKEDVANKVDEKDEKTVKESVSA